MPTPVYDNKWLDARKPGKDYTVDVPVSDARKQRVSAGMDDPLAAAKAFLAKPDPYANPTLTPDDQAGLDARLDWNGQNNQMAADIAQQRKGGVRRATEAMSTGGDIASLASLPLLPMPALSGAAMALGGMLHAPDQLRRAYAPQDGETRPGLGEALSTGLEMLPGVGLAGHMGQEAVAAEDTYGLGQHGRIGPSRYEAPTGAVDSPNFQHAPNPNQTLGVARGIANETGDPLEAILRGGRKSGTNAQSVQALMKLAASGSVEPTAQLGREADAAATRATVYHPSPMEEFYKNNPPGEGRMTGQFKEGRGGLRDLAAHVGMEPHAMPVPEDAWGSNLMPGLQTPGDKADSVDRARRRSQRLRLFGESLKSGQPLQAEF